MTILAILLFVLSILCLLSTAHYYVVMQRNLDAMDLVQQYEYERAEFWYNVMAVLFFATLALAVVLLPKT